MAEHLTADQRRQPMLVACTSCLYVWPVIWMPCPASSVVKVAPRICPSCHQSAKGAVVATQANGDLARYVDQLAAELVRAREQMAEVQSEQLAHG